jgi:hypothetical protein
MGEMLYRKLSYVKQFRGKMTLNCNTVSGLNFRMEDAELFLGSLYNGEWYSGELLYGELYNNKMSQSEFSDGELSFGKL